MKTEASRRPHSAMILFMPLRLSHNEASCGEALSKIWGKVGCQAFARVRRVWKTGEGLVLLLVLVKYDCHSRQKAQGFRRKRHKDAGCLMSR